MSDDGYRISPRTEEQPVEGCAHCGTVYREHGQRYTIAAGWHSFAVPDPDLLRRRMWYRRTVRRLARALRATT